MISTVWPYYTHTWEIYIRIDWLTLISGYELSADKVILTYRIMKLKLRRTTVIISVLHKWNAAFLHNRSTYTWNRSFFWGRCNHWEDSRPCSLLRKLWPARHLHHRLLRCRRWTRLDWWMGREVVGSGIHRGLYRHIRFVGVDNLRLGEGRHNLDSDSLQ